MRIEAIFGGILVLFVLVLAAYAILTGNRPPVVIDPIGGGTTAPAPVTASARDNAICGCFSEGYSLAGSNVGVMSAQYRTGVEVCRSQLGEDGGCAFTAGWNARLSARPFEANCRTYLKKGQLC